MRETLEKTKSFWEEDIEIATKEKLAKNIKVDVAIVGGGISGLTAAYILARNGKKVAVLESEELCSGQTSRTTGHLVNVLDDRYFELERLFGEEKSKLAAVSHFNAIKFIEAICLKQNIQCQFKRVPVYLFCPPAESSAILHKEFEAAKRAGLEVEIIDRAPIDFDTGKCLYFPDQAEISPLQYLKGLITAIESYGGEIYCHTRVKNIEDGKITKLETESGFTITANQTIIATNTPINNRVLIHTKQAAYRTYVIVGKILKDSVPHAIFYDTLDPYHYVRVVEGKENDYLMVGGEDHRTGENDHPDLCYQKLLDWTKERFPFFNEITHQWSGQILEPVDSLAFIGKNPYGENVFVVTGDSGNGLTHGTLGAILISDLILNKASPFEKVYDPSRITPKAIQSFLDENFNTLVQYTDWLKLKSEIPEEKNSGKVISKNGKKIAVYKDENNELHFLNAICPHLYGIVRWNESEKTWDCPCHGSRFSCKGKVIIGPSNSDLEAL